MKVRATLVCVRMQQQLSGAVTLGFSATYPQRADSDLSGSLPNGELAVTLSQAAADQIYLGNEYTLDLTEALAETV